VILYRGNRNGGILPRLRQTKNPLAGKFRPQAEKRMLRILFAEDCGTIGARAFDVLIGSAALMREIKSDEIASRQALHCRRRA
jgi:hypothetical protein